MKKINVFLSSIFILLRTGFFLIQHNVLAESLTNTEIAKNILIENGYSNFNAINKGSYILGTLLSITNLVLDAVIGAGGLQDPNLRNSITKAYHQGKRVKIVTEYGTSM